MIEVCFGNEPGQSVRVKFAEPLTVVDKQASVITATAETFTRAALMWTRTRDKGKSCRMFVIEPVDGPETTFYMAPFFVRGSFQVVEKVNNSRKAVEDWKAFEPE